MKELSGNHLGKTCAVFGGSSYVGQAIAKHLAQGGANLLLVDLASHKRDSLPDEIRATAADTRIIHRTVTSGDEGCEGHSFLSFD